MKNLTKLAQAAGLQKFQLALPDYWVAEMQKEFDVDPRGGKFDGEVIWIVWSFDQYVAYGEPYSLSSGAEKLLALWEARKAARATHHQGRFGKEPYEFELWPTLEKELRKENSKE